MYQHSENLHYIMNQYFTNPQRIMLQNHAWIKDPFKVQVSQRVFVFVFLVKWF